MGSPCDFAQKLDTFFMLTARLFDFLDTRLYVVDLRMNSVSNARFKIGHGLFQFLWWTS